MSKEAKRKIKSNGLRNSMGAGTPESVRDTVIGKHNSSVFHVSFFLFHQVTLSVDSLPHRQLYPSKTGTWQRSPIVGYSGTGLSALPAKSQRPSMGK